MEQEPRHKDWLEENLNYIVAGIIFYAAVYYRTKLNEIIFIVIFSPSLVYFLILHPLLKEDKRNSISDK